jgi:prephenate dehydrogenase
MKHVTEFDKINENEYIDIMNNNKNQIMDILNQYAEDVYGPDHTTYAITEEQFPQIAEEISKLFK